MKSYINHRRTPALPQVTGTAGGNLDSNTSAPAEPAQDSDKSNASSRRPAATIAFVVMAQLQFLSLLSLVESALSADAWLSDFILGLRWRIMCDGVASQLLHAPSSALWRNNSSVVESSMQPKS